MLDLVYLGVNTAGKQKASRIQLSSMQAEWVLELERNVLEFQWIHLGLNFLICRMGKQYLHNRVIYGS